MFTMPSGWGCQQWMLSGEQYQQLSAADQALVLGWIKTSKLENDEL